MKKRFFAVILAALLIVSTFAGSVITASAEEGTTAAQESKKNPPNPNRLKEYTPSKDVKETFNIKFALPGAWTGEDGSAARATWEKYEKSAGLYWWGSLDNPDEAKDAAGHGWPGWKMKKGDQENLYTSLVPKGTASMIFDNFIDGGMDKSYPEYNTAQQTKDLTGLEYLQQGDSDYYPKEFWDFLYDNYQAEFEKNPNYQIPGFGDYAKNFFYVADDESIYHYINDMVFVVDLVNTDRATFSPVSGKVGLDGAFYFDYGNGEFGIWPTKEMCIEKEGLPVDDKGNVDYSQIAQEEEPTTEEPTTVAPTTVAPTTVKDDNDLGADPEEGTTKATEPSADSKLKVQNKTGFITNEHTDAYKTTVKRDFVVFGNYTGKYWTDKSEVKPDVKPSDTDTTTTPAPNNNDATSNEGDKSNSGSGSNDSNGSIATGDFSAVAIIGVVAIAGLGVFYFIRRRRSSK